MKLYKHYFDKTDTPFEESFQKNKNTILFGVDVNIKYSYCIKLQK